MVMEDFSFPKISNSVSQLAFSPSLWRVTSLVYPEFGDEEENGGEHGREAAFQSKSFSNLEQTVHEANNRGGGGGGGGCHNLDTEKMDMLWEDFNEELKVEGRVRLSSSKFKIKTEEDFNEELKLEGRVRLSSSKFKIKTEAAARKEKEEESPQLSTTVELCYAQTLQVSKVGVSGGRTEIYHRRRQSISTLALMKTFKKIIFLRQKRK